MGRDWIYAKNEGSKFPLTSFAVSIDRVESLTGIDFYPMLIDSLELKIEKEQTSPSFLTSHPFGKFFI